MKWSIQGKLLACVLFCSCATYSDSTRAFRTAVYANDTNAALETLEKSSLARSSSDKVLYYLEKGMALFIGNRFKEAAREWDLAASKMEELYTVSISRTAGTLLVSETLSDYDGEVHERVLVPAFSALAYLAMGEPNEAIVEARRTARVLEQLNKDNDGKNAYNRDSFAHYLAGMTFEMKREWDSAIIEYRRALEAVRGNQTWSNKIKAQPIVEALGQLAEFRNRSDILATLHKDYPDIKVVKDPNFAEKAEIIAVYEAGRSPLKKSQDMMIPLNGGFIRISYPEFRDQFYVSSGASILVDQRPAGRLNVAQDVGAAAKRGWEDRKGKYIARMTARAVAKGLAVSGANRQFGLLGGLAASVAASATETADTRSWTTLPDLILMKRVEIPANRDVVVRIVPDSGKPFETTLKLRPGEKRLVRTRTFD